MAENRNVRIKNRKASFEYFFDLEFTAGISLTGPEVKSVRDGKVSLGEAYCFFDGNILKIKGLHISEYKNAGYAEQEPLRDRVLLLQKNEIKKLKNKMKDVGYTIIPTELFVSERGFIKLNIALARGKKMYDKREDLKKKDTQRDIDRAY